ncbi:hypothetical protein [Rhizobium sp. Root1220]|uniref:hypothetical protein n=1 Tax=Rhizobium sp. Root1220 TaxID=1736432 RepID=UPI0006F5F606|nr:hypothetical protein [Rhizobium sp. Root1220]KQV83657.1 hypothetical protein ASC90_20450 [Rhizobium sp. Root1220]
MSIEKANERREYEKADARGRKSARSVKLPGDTTHANRSDSAETIARRLTLAKREKRTKDAGRG